MPSERALHVLHLQSGKLYGGVENLLTTLARCRECAADMSPHFALHYPGRLKVELEAKGVPVEDLGAARMRRPWSILASRRRLARLIERTPFDVAVAHSAWAYGIAAPALRAAGIPVVFWLHDAAKGTHWVERWAGLSKPAAVICNSRFTLGTLGRIYPGMDGRVYYGPVPAPDIRLSPEARASLRRELGAGAEHVLVIQPSRMQAWKGHVRQLRALGRLRDLPAWIMVFVGGPQRPAEERYYASLSTLASELGIADRVRFLGQRSDVPRLLAAADIHCQPNEAPEPFGLVFVEAMYAGLPVITMNFGGGAEVVTPETGILADDDEQLVVALRRLMQDAELRARLGAAGPARARALCAPERQLPALCALLRDTVGARAMRAARS